MNLIRRWIRMLWPNRQRRSPSANAAAAGQAAQRSLAAAEQARVESQRLRTAAEKAAEEVKRHNTANHYAAWLNEVMRGQR